MHSLRHYYFILLFLSIFAVTTEKTLAAQLPSGDLVAICQTDANKTPDQPNETNPAEINSAEKTESSATSRPNDERVQKGQLPVPAANSTPGTDITGTESSHSADQSLPPSEKPISKAKRTRGNTSLPLKITSLLAGIAVGAPVASFRRAIGENAEAAETIAYGKKHSGLKFAARLVLLPVCLLPGAIEGVSYAVENSCKHCGSAPLSKESFSLGKLGPSEK